MTDNKSKIILHQEPPLLHVHTDYGKKTAHKVKTKWIEHHMISREKPSNRKSIPEHRGMHKYEDKKAVRT